MADSRILLAHSPQGAIFACPCGAIHITFGGVTLSFTLEEFVVMLELHHQAIGGLEKNMTVVRDLCQPRHFHQNVSKSIH